MDKEKIIISYFKLNEKERQERYLTTNGLAFLKKGLLAVGYTHFVTLQDDGSVAAFGNNEYGQCNVDGWRNVVKVAAGDFHTVALKSDGTVSAAGDNRYGQCNVEEWRDITDIFADKGFTVGVTADGKIMATHTAEKTPQRKEPTSSTSASTKANQIYDQTNDIREFKFHIEDNKAIIDKYLGDSPSVVIPSHINGYPVEVIGACAFEHSKIKQVVFPPTLKIIENHAFGYCGNLEAVQIPTGPEQIGSYAFMHCIKLRALTLPASVKSVGNWIVLGCTNLRELTIPKRCKDLIASSGITLKINYLESDASTDKPVTGVYNDFEYIKTDGKVSITKYNGNADTVVIPEEIDGVPVRCIGKKAFYRKELSSLILSQNLREIGEEAFRNCYRLLRIKIPYGVETIGNNAFAHCVIKELILPKSVKTIGDSAFMYCSSLSEIKIPYGLEAIGKFAFYGCDIKELILPESVKKIWDYAFMDNSSLNKLVIPDSVEEIGYHAFHSAVRHRTEISNETKRRLYNYDRIFGN